MTPTSFPLQTLKTFAFKDQRRISRDPLADNAIWANDVKDAIRRDLTEHGMVEDTSGSPDFLIAFYVGLRDRYDMSYVDDSNASRCSCTLAMPVSLSLTASPRRSTAIVFSSKRLTGYRDGRGRGTPHGSVRR